MKRREKRINWRVKPAKKMIQANPAVLFRIKLRDAMEMARLLRRARMPEDDTDKINKIILGSTPLLHTVEVQGGAYMHRLSPADGPSLSSDVLLARSKFLFREAGIKVGE